LVTAGKKIFWLTKVFLVITYQIWSLTSDWNAPLPHSLGVASVIGRGADPFPPSQSLLSPGWQAGTAAMRH